MYSKLLIDKRYSFKSESDVRFNNVDIPSSKLGDKLDVVIDGVSHSLCRKWLSLLAHFEINLPLLDCLKIKFIPCDSGLFKYRRGVKLISTSPIVRRAGFRVVPGYSRYEVSRSGIVVSIKSGKVLSVRDGPYGYPVVGVYDPDKKRHRDIGLHILIASAWVVNKSPQDYHVVNHIDGNKANHRTSNLEWTNGSSNNIHAIDSGLRTDNLPCSVFDITNNSIKEFNSVSEAFVSIGITRSAKKTTETVDGGVKPKLFKGRYFINRSNSGICNKDLSGFVERPTRTNKGPYQVIGKDNLVAEYDNIPKMASALSIPSWGIYDALMSGPSKEYMGYRVRVSSTDPWPEVANDIVHNRAKSIMATNGIKSIKFRSIREARLHFNCDKTTITNRLSGKINLPWNGWSFKSVNV